MAYKQGSTGGGGGAWTFVSSSTASSSATIDFTGLSTEYMYMFVLQGVVPATDDVTLYFRTSSDNGSTFDSSAGNYMWSSIGVRVATTYSSGSSSATQINLTTWDANSGIGNLSTEGCNHIVYLYNPSDTVYTHINYVGSYRSPTNQQMVIDGSGARNSAADVDAVRFLMSSGNISTGTFKLYSLAAS